MVSLERHLLSNLRATGLLAPGSRGLVAVSGGPDSLALLHLLAALRGPLRLTLAAVHFDHGLRPESAAEAAWVVRQAEGLGLPAHLRRTDALRGRSAGVQAAARAWRRAEAAALARETGAAWVATGHQRDDQVETLLLKLLRGAHLTRLRGMAPRSGLFVRPLLHLGRADLEAYLRAKGVTWLEDPSNRSPHYKRNRVRHELVPLLESLTDGRLARRLTALAEQSAQLAALLAAQPALPQNPPEAPPHWLAAAPLVALPAARQGEALHRFVQARLPGEMPHAVLQGALGLLHTDKPAWRLDLPGGRALWRKGDRLVLAPREQPPPPRRVVAVGCWEVEAPEPLRPRLADGAGGVGLTLYNLPPGTRLTVRTRRPGDRFQPAWRARPLKLKDFLRDQGVPLWARDEVPLVEWAGRIVAVYPHHVAAGFAAPAGEHPPLPLALDGA